MRKFFPRIFNIISLILALLVFYPWLKIARYFEIIGDKFNITLFGSTEAYFITNTSHRLFLIPLILISLSLIFFIASLIDRRKDKNKKTSYPIQNMALAPLYYMGVLASISGILISFFEKKDFVIQSYDFFGLGALLSKISLFSGTFTYLTGVLIYAIILGVNIVLIISTIKVNKNGFFPKFIVYLLFVIFSILSIKGVTDYYSGDLSFKALFDASFRSGVNPTEMAITVKAEHYIYLGLTALIIVLYIVFGSVIAHKVNVAYKESIEAEPIEDTPIEEAIQVEKSEPKTETITKNINFIINIPESRQVKYAQSNPIDAAPDSFAFEDSDLNKIYSTDFQFNGTMMLKTKDVSSYYVKNKKFLTISNSGKTLTFRCQIDKAVKLLTEYPQVLKDRTENHAIWFRIDDQNEIKKDDIISIIKASYEDTLTR